VLGTFTLLAAPLAHKRFRIAAIRPLSTSYVAGFGSDFRVAAAVARPPSRVPPLGIATVCRPDVVGIKTSGLVRIYAYTGAVLPPTSRARVPPPRT